MSEAAVAVDVARLPLLLGELRLPTVAALWPQFRYYVAAATDEIGLVLGG